MVLLTLAHIAVKYSSNDKLLSSRRHNRAYLANNKIYSKFIS